MNSYPHHIGDFIKATRHLTTVERALYRDMLDVYYDTERPLDSDGTRLARRLLARTDEERAAVDSVLQEFFVLQEDGWHNDRCDAEIAAYRAKLEQASQAGRRSAQVRAGRKAPKPVKGGGAGASGAGVEHPSDGSATGVERPLNGRATNQNQNQNQNQIDPSDHHLADAVVPTLPGQWIEVYRELFGFEVDPSNFQQRQKFMPLAKAWIDAGVSVGQMRDAVAKARDEAKGGIGYLPAYVDRVMATMSAAAAVVAAARTGENFATTNYGDGVRLL